MSPKVRDRVMKGIEKNRERFILRSIVEKGNAIVALHWNYVVEKKM